MKKIEPSCVGLDAHHNCERRARRKLPRVALLSSARNKVTHTQTCAAPRGATLAHTPKPSPLRSDAAGFLVDLDKTCMRMYLLMTKAY